MKHVVIIYCLLSVIFLNGCTSPSTHAQLSGGTGMGLGYAISSGTPLTMQH
jgi:hypothetical protein